MDLQRVSAHVCVPSPTSHSNRLALAASRPSTQQLNTFVTDNGVSSSRLLAVSFGSRFPVWSSLARDYFSIMASSASSERAFSSAGITISKRQNRLKADIVEALQFLKCAFRRDLVF
jgi:hypothetical protein